MTETKVFKKYDNLSKNELNTKNSREVYVRNDILTIVLKHCRGKKKSQNKNRRNQKKINDSKF